MKKRDVRHAHNLILLSFSCFPLSCGADKISMYSGLKAGHSYIMYCSIYIFDLMPSDSEIMYNEMFSFSGLDPSNTDHNDYLEKITNDAEEKLKKMVEHIITEGNKKKAVSVRDECVQHLLFCKSKCEDFQGKKDTLKVNLILNVILVHYHRYVLYLPTECTWQNLYIV